jgi:ribosome-associated translation inhibitor RaiA
MTTTQITYRHMDASPSVDQEVEKGVEKLASHFPDLLSCHVVLEQPHKSQQKGVAFHVLLELNVPGQKLVVSHDPGDASDREDAHKTLHHAFAAARRELERWTADRRDVRARVPSA